jgi:hypothetical protein
VEYAVNVAEILARAGLATVATVRHESPVTGKPATLRAATAVTAVTERNDEADLIGATRRPSISNPRVVVHFRVAGDLANAWATALGAPGDTVDSLVGDLAERLDGRLAEWRLRRAEETR